jgi:predicted nucleic acid-binding protein
VSELYAESSAILAWLLGEPGSNRIVKQIDEAETVVTSVLTVLEIERALIRAAGQGLCTAAEAQKLRGMFARVTRSWVMMEISGEVLRGAATAFPVEPVRTLDALHLSTALVFVQAFPGLRLLTLDRRIESNARALGLCDEG